MASTRLFYTAAANCRRDRNEGISISINSMVATCGPSFLNNLIIINNSSSIIRTNAEPVSLSKERQQTYVSMMAGLLMSHDHGGAVGKGEITDFNMNVIQMAVPTLCSKYVYIKQIA